ncbi:YybH family protein [Fibrella aquatilis]|uniref:SgcJ/EcaC family oxidoreductase n=1 Tax=Fibrella aquatilis TaxID=2817059 RepID=A0A939G6L4_9BACT|nr:SgcJ/EcaC family oxidoreductase [Fibrella aquatilis]MBO0931985.1 SgcJ/EcaC family oxidoreductase [Fibrella aquatilis]
MNYTSQLSQPDTEQTLRLLEQFVTLWNAKDADAFGQIFTENAEFTDIVGQTALGRRALIEQHRYPFAVVNKEAVLAMQDLYIRPLSDELVLVTAQWSCENSTTPTGQVLPTRHGVVQLVCQRDEAGTWLIRLVHNTDTNLMYERQERFIKK